ncbi:GNAT family N-acetyltransferase [Sulfitobacter sp. S190]|uniref:GNAT family N-acetyltransferase n=1 Tax=Sulfitobacter sp. S190 TaxID=2867022 RepID=UPI0021A2CFF1|nr:GNAT family N-acetyltransferase [Sulfitobacter sp. S190]UWR23558.1 GNAT family N-acetyltransferase [Sulfitobacter sp. S190]
MEPITLRPFVPADRDWLVEAHAVHYARDEGFDASFGVLVGQILDDFIAAPARADERGWIAWQDGVRLGSIFCVWLDARTAKLRLFLLTPGARGQGLGQKLLDTCTGFAAARGYAGMQLWTHKSHAAACALYRRNGWRLVAEKPVVSFGKPNIEQTYAISF